MKGFALAIVIGACLWPAAGTGATDWPTAPPEQQGFDSAALAEVITAAKASGQPIHSITVLRGGDVILDAAFYPYDPSTLHDMASVTKSVTTTLVGIAAGEDKLDLDAPMLSFFPELDGAGGDASKAAVTVRQLTQNVSGLACIGAPEEVTLAEMEASPDFLRFALDLPMRAAPGSRFDYCSPGMHILSAIVERTTGVRMAAYAEERLFEPLGITDVYWEPDPQGITRGWGDLHLTPAGMIRLGTLWLEGGAWQGRQLVPSDWADTATTVAVRSDRYEDYGYGFWVGPKSEPIHYFFASGRGGQRILVAPPLELVMAITGGGIDPGDFIDPIVATLVSPGEPLPPNPEGERRLADAIEAAAAPPPAQSYSSPDTAAAVSGRTYVFDANPYGLRSIMLSFAEGAPTFTIDDPTGITTRPMGLDGLYRWSIEPHGLRYGATARWTDSETVVVDFNTVGDIRAYTITARFAEDLVNLTIQQRDEPSLVRLAGRAAPGG